MLRSPLTATLVTAACMVAHQTSKQAVRWPVGLRVVQVAEVSRGNHFGRREGWIDENASFQVRSEGEGPYASLLVPELHRAKRDAFRAGLAELHTRR